MLMILVVLLLSVRFRGGHKPGVLASKIKSHGDTLKEGK